MQENFQENAWRILLARIIGVVVGLIVGVFALMWVSPIIARSLATVQSGWYISRSTGIIAYLLSWLATVAGLLITGRQSQQWPGIIQTNDIHRQASLASLVMMGIHVVALMTDTYMHYTWFTLFVPSLQSPYAPIAVALGQIALPIAIVIIATAEWRQIVGKAWRWIHVGAFFVYFAGTLHGIFSGNDTQMSLISLMYVVTISSVIFLTVYRVVLRRNISAAVDAV